MKSIQQIEEIEKRALSLKEALPVLMVSMDKWYESLKAAVLATTNFARLIEEFSKNEHMALSTWENEGGSLEREIYS